MVFELCCHKVEFLRKNKNVGGAHGSLGGEAGVCALWGGRTGRDGDPWEAGPLRALPLYRRLGGSHGQSAPDILVCVHQRSLDLSDHISNGTGVSKVPQPLASLSDFTVDPGTRGFLSPSFHCTQPHVLQQGAVAVLAHEG